MTIDDDARREINADGRYKDEHSLDLRCLLSAAIYRGLLEDNPDEVDRIIGWVKHHNSIRVEQYE